MNKFIAFPPTTCQKEIPAEVVSKLAEGAAFLWNLRAAAVQRPDYTLADLLELDERLEVQLAGLRAVGETGWQLLQSVMEAGDPGAVFTAMILAVENGDENRPEVVIQVAVSIPETFPGLIGALAWLLLSQVSRPILKLLRSQEPLLRRVGLSAACAHRRDPGNSILSDALKDADPTVRARALRAVGELGAVELISYVRPSFQHENPSCRFWAAWSAALLQRDKEALQLLRTFALAGKPFAEPAVQMIMRADDMLVCHRVMQRLKEMPEHRRTAVVAAGVLGDPNAIPWLIEQMCQPALARVAGEAFCSITGADLSFHDLDTEPPEEPEPELAESNEEPEKAEEKEPIPAGPTEEAEDETDPDENLHWPNPTLVQQWWDRNKGGFAKGTRYLGGKPINEETLHEVLRQGKQRQRAAAALELALRKPEKGLFEVRAPAGRQMQLLGIK